jgi:hypothetical protein
MSHHANILIAAVCLFFVGYSWWSHFKVKDGIARLMFLWGCGMIFLFILVRMLTYLLLEFGIIDGINVNLIFTYNVWLIYALVVGQFIIQNRKD